MRQSPAMLVDRHPEEGVRPEVGQIDAIEALRGVAVAWVVLFHYVAIRQAQATDPWVAWVAATRPVEVLVRNGYLGVDLFFLITGFLLVLPWARRVETGRPAPSARDFLVRRIRRIVPAYYVQLLVLFLVFLPLLRGLDFMRANAGLVGFNAAAHALFLHYLTPLSSASLELNGALWTLALEAQFYLLLPLVAPLFVRAPLACGLAMLIAAGGWKWLAANDLQPVVDFEMRLGARWGVAEAAIRHLLATQLPGYLGHFALGMGLGVTWLRLEVRPASASELAALRAAMAAALAFLYWAFGLAGIGAMGPTLAWMAVLAAFGALMFALLRGAVRARWLLAPAMALGRISYSAYLYHVPLLLLCSALRSLDGAWATLPLYLVLLVSVAWASHRWVELPFMAPSSRAAPRVAPPAAPIIGG